MTYHNNAPRRTNNRLGSPSRTRRTILKGMGGTAAVLGAPFVLTRRAKAAGQIVARNPGGAYGDALQKAYYEPFTKETGIEVLGVPATAGKLVAMVEAGNTEIDVGDITELTALVLRENDALVPLKYENWEHVNPDDMKSVSRPDMVGSIWAANALCYNTEVFPTGSHPQSCADLWDVEKFPGPRMMASMQAGFPELEFALLADGVPKEELYPIDIDRAFKSLARIKPNVAKFWDTGGVQVDLLSQREAVCGTAYNGRIFVGKQKGAPVDVEWNQANNQMQVQCIIKGSKNQDNAQRFIDFIMQPEIQAEFAKQIPYGPTNRKAFDFIPAEVAENLPNYFEEKIFYQDAQWWAENRDEVEQVWNEWILA